MSNSIQASNVEPVTGKTPTSEKNIPDSDSEPLKSLRKSSYKIKNGLKYKIAGDAVQVVSRGAAVAIIQRETLAMVCGLPLNERIEYIRSAYTVQQRPPVYLLVKLMYEGTITVFDIRFPDAPVNEKENQFKESYMTTIVREALKRERVRIYGETCV